MHDDALERLSQANPIPDNVPAPPIEHVLLRIQTDTGAARPSARRPIIARAGLAVVALAGVCIAILFVISLRHTAGSTSPAAGRLPPSEQALIAELAPLRRPQTKADLDSPIVQSILHRQGLSAMAAGTPIRSLIRRVGTLPNGHAVYVIPRAPLTAKQRSQLPAAAAQAGTGAGVTLQVVSGAGATCCTTAAGLADGGAGLETGYPAETFLIVPDGVSKITVFLPRQRIAGEPAYAHSDTITVAVHDNLAYFAVRRYADAVGTENMIWYGPTGNVIRRFGTTKNLNRVIPAPKPTPPTSLSQAAEKNPATPNPVSITPTAGGIHTSFTVAFGILLTKASYQYVVSGPGGVSCHSHISYGGGGGISGGPDAVRGQIFKQALKPGSNGQPGNVTAWCPGTYTVSVAAFGVPPRKTKTYSPFGSVTFTVRR